MFFQPLYKHTKLKNALFFGTGIASAGLCVAGILYKNQIKKAVNKAISNISCDISKDSIKEYLGNFIFKDKKNKNQHDNTCNKCNNHYCLFTDDKVAITVICDSNDNHKSIKKDIISQILDKFDNIESVSFLTSSEATEYFYSDNISNNTNYPVLLVYGECGLLRKIENADNIAILLEKLCKK